MEYNKVYMHTYPSSSLSISRTEILRYMSCGSETEEVKSLIDKYLPEAINALSCKGSFVYLPSAVSDGVVKLGDVLFSSASLIEHLSNSTGALVFSLSCGLEIDRLIAKYSHILPSAALCINAIATTAIEGYADEFCNEMELCFSKEGLHLNKRFSPGYGDLSLAYQPAFLNLTNASKLCGITLTNSYMMTPSKSVTAVAGVGSVVNGCKPDKCSNCNKINCQYSKR